MQIQNDLRDYLVQKQVGAKTGNPAKFAFISLKRQYMCQSNYSEKNA